MAWAIVLLVPLALCHAHSYQRQTYASTLQCRVDDPLSCSQAKHEVCVFANGQYRCECPTGVNRLPDGRCLSVDECARPSLNGCHKDANCIDKQEGYTCECKPGFADISPDRTNKPGRICRKTSNECGQRETYGVDCDPNAACVDTPEGFQCVCQPGFADVSTSVSKLPGRKCVEVVNECTTGKADCSCNADCFDRDEGYECKCRPGFVDASPDTAKYPGRVCNRPKSPEYYGQTSRQPQCTNSNQCGPNEECRFNAKGEMVCQCKRGAVQQSDGKCKVFSQCERANECDRNAICSNTYDGFKCQCKAGFIDLSPDPYHLPGRKCEKITNECADGTADCSPFADCIDLQQGYMCKCKMGYTDVSSRYQLQPGRKCSQAANQCSDRKLNSCDDNADCVQLPDGYTCKCFSGYVDVSSNANLEPGRVCTLSTVCPVQATDLVFLIDGSGSIGSYIFQTEVLRFLAEFTELFDIAPDKTRVSVVQYSDQIRHEFGLDDYKDSRSLHEAIKNIEYLTGLTRTGAAIEHIATEAFSERRGARPLSDRVARVAIVITDGRSQDNVTTAANNARRQNIQLFAVGVTNHVLQAELEEITGAKDRTFHVNAFEDLNTRLRSAIQRVTCPQNEAPKPSGGPCDPSSHAGCDRALNQVCMLKNGQYTCTCPDGFDEHPVTKACGGDVCNPEIPTSCPDPEICEKTPFGNWRCTCPADLGWRDQHTGACKIGEPPQDLSESQDECDPADSASCGPNAKCVRGPGGSVACQCDPGYVINIKSDKCQKPGTCDPSVPNSCDARKKEKCLLDSNGDYTCQCDASQFYKRHNVTEICLIDECSAGTHDCDVNARCTDTDESFICTCNSGFLDKSPDQARKPGRVCTQLHNECEENRHNCSKNADCIDLPDGFLCRCKESFVDVSPNMKVFAGLDCRALVDECASKTTNNCHEHAICIDTRDAYKCQCKTGYVDHDELRNPGRDCRKANQLCESGRHDCDKNAQCIERGTNDYECVCKPGFLDRSPLPHRPGRKCLERVCLDDTKHDCHAAAVCQEVDGPEKYTCKCRDGYVDANKNKPGRECRELVNECLDSSLNDCDPAATCRDTPDSYECECPIGSRDISKDPSKPGRNCFGLVNECLMPHLNNCSRFADCTDKEEGYECKCKPDYHDQNPSNPGTNCKFIINECSAENLNDCDKKAECIDTIDGYECKCIAPYVDQMPQNPGRVCRYNECADPKSNDCDKNADCIDTDDGFICQCKQGFFDENTDPLKTGRVCVGLVIDQPQQAEKTTISPNLVPCGNTFCKIDLHEVCIGGSKCDCRPGESRSSPNDKCVAVTSVPIVVRVIDFDGEPLHYSTDYSKPTSPEHVQIVEDAVKGLGEVFRQTDIAPRYVTTDVNYITSPKVENRYITHHHYHKLL
nr:EGF and von Willebrand factor and SEA domain containing protein [Haemonchus contortus]